MEHLRYKSYKLMYISLDKDFLVPSSLSKTQSHSRDHLLFLLFLPWFKTATFEQPTSLLGHRENWHFSNVAKLWLREVPFLHWSTHRNCEPAVSWYCSCKQKEHQCKERGHFLSDSPCFALFLITFWIVNTFIWFQIQKIQSGT